MRNDSPYECIAPKLDGTGLTKVRERKMRSAGVSVTISSPSLGINYIGIS
jgi:hypothetical protein